MKKLWWKGFWLIIHIPKIKLAAELILSWYLWILTPCHRFSVTTNSDLCQMLLLMQTSMVSVLLGDSLEATAVHAL